MRVGFGRAVTMATAVLFASGCFVQAGFAGQGNVLYLVQDTTSGSGNGQSFQSDQHLSINSSIGTPLRPATQSGGDNSASITIDSSCGLVSTSCGYAALTQSNDYQRALTASGNTGIGRLLNGLSSTFGGNSATVSVTGQGTASASQYGFGNDASISATDASASISQIGLGNSARLTVTPLGAGAPPSYALNQIGLNNSANLVVIATAGTSSSYTQIGAGLNNGTPAVPVQVQTTRSVDITQTNFGTFGH